jgi:hypothetical protein
MKKAMHKKYKRTTILWKYLAAGNAAAKIKKLGTTVLDLEPFEFCVGVRPMSRRDN